MLINVQLELDLNAVYSLTSVWGYNYAADSFTKIIYELAKMINIYPKTRYKTNILK